MVRLKQRYILFEITYPPQGHKEEEYGAFVGFAEKPSASLLRLHKQSPSNINPKTIANKVKQTIQEYYGDFGASGAMQLNVKYFNNKTSTGILRCGRTNFQFVLAALTLINDIDGQPLIINCAHVSATIKKAEQFAIARDRTVIRTVQNYQRLESGRINTI